MSSVPATSVSPPPASVERPSGSKRVVSLDQYRGYAVAGMLVVNFLGHHENIHQFFQHNNTHFSWADSIMPAFIFVAGISFRLSIVKRLSKNRPGTTMKFVRRSLALVLISAMMYGIGGRIDKWADMTPAGVWNFLANILKADLWEVLAIIGVAQLLILPVMAASSRVRLFTTIAFSVGHVLLSGWFNYAFVQGQENWMDEAIGLVGRTAWDGGIFGLFSWAVPMLAGTLVFDMMQTRNSGQIVRSLLLWGAGLMAIGYLASCLTTLYDVRESNTIAVAWTPPAKEEAEDNQAAVTEAPDKTTDETAVTETAENQAADPAEKKEAEQEARKKERAAAEKKKEEAFNQMMDERRATHAISPVIPPFANMQNRPWTSLLAEAPFVPPPPQEQRKLNYWMMTKRISSQSFMLFASGFVCAVYALFVLACDIGSLRSRVFTTFGENALVAYIIHHAVQYVVLPIVPKDSPVWWATTGFAIFFVITYMIMRYFNRTGVYVRL